MSRLARFLLVAVMLSATLVAGGAVAHAVWSVHRPLPSVAVVSGSFSLTATWATQPELGGMLPGDVRYGTMRVTHAGGTPWTYGVDVVVAAPLRSYLATQWYPNAACAGPALPVPARAGLALAAASSTTLCVKFTFASGAPGTLQGARAEVVTVVTAEQVRP